MEKKNTPSQAVILWLGMMLSYLAAGFLQVYGLKFSLVIWLNLVFAAICFILAARKEEGVRFLGLVKDRFWISCGVGMICSVVIVLFNGVLPGIVTGASLASAQSLIFRLLYYMIFISIPEELIFRGFIWSSLEKSGMSKRLVIVVSGVFFMLLHIPYQAVMSGGVLALLLNGYLLTLLMTFVWHLVFCMIYRKSGAIYGAILFHAVMDWSNYLFV